MSVRTLIGAVGAGVGFAIGGAAGARWGYALGSVVGNLVDPQQVRGPSLGDVAQQTAQEGGAIPIIFGMSPPITGNVIATSQPEIVESSSGGKGGPEVVSESVFVTYAIGICEGPVDGIVRAWRNNILVYDATDDPIVSEEDNDAFLEHARFFLGTYDQEPSEDLEAVFGVGTTAAHRGVAYMVMVEEDVTDTRGAIPQWQFQVSRAGAFNYLQEVFTSSGTFEPKAGVTSYDVLIVGSGGRGSGAAGNPNKSANGGGGGGEVKWVEGVEVLSSIAVSIDSSNDSSTFDWREPTKFGADSALWAAAGQRGSFDDEAAEPPRASGSGGLDPNGDGDLQAPRAAGSADNPGFAGGAAVVSGGGSIGGGGGGAGAPGSTGQGGAGVYMGDKVGDDLGDEGWFGGGGGGAVSNHAATGDLNTSLGGKGGGGRGSYGSFLSIIDPQFDIKDAQPGMPNTGGGGGGIASAYATDYPPTGGAYNGTGKDGGSGIVVVRWIDPDNPSPNANRLRNVITAICARANVPSDLIDVSMLSEVENVPGFIVTNQYEAVQALQALGDIYRFDIAEFDAQIRFVPRGENSILTLTEADLVDDGEDLEEEFRRADPISIPRLLNLNYYDVESGLTTSKQTSERAGDWRAQGDLSLSSAVVMTSDQAAQAVDIAHKVMIEDAKGQITITVPDNRIAIVPSSVLILQAMGQSMRLRVVRELLLDGMQKLDCLRDRQSAYTSDVEGIPPPPQVAPPSSIVGPTLIVPLDIPLLRDADDSQGMSYYVAVAGTLPGWRGASVELSRDGGATFESSRLVGGRALIGTLTAILGDHPQEFPDTHNAVVVSFGSVNAELEDTDISGMLDRVNLAAIGSPEVGWELINFADADELDATTQTWRLETLLRGRKATIPRQHEVTEQFVLLDRAQLWSVPAAVADIDTTLTFRATSIGMPVDTGTLVDMAYVGHVQRERAIAFLEVAPGDTSALVSWIGTGRLGGDTSAAHGAFFDGYRVIVRDDLAQSVIDTSEQDLEVSTAGVVGELFIGVCQVNTLTGEGPITWWPYDPLGDPLSTAYLWQLGKTHPFIGGNFLGRVIFADADEPYYVDLINQGGSGVDYNMRKFPIDAESIGDSTGGTGLAEEVTAFIRHPSEEIIYVVTADYPGGDGVVRKLLPENMILGGLLSGVQETQRGYLYRDLVCVNLELYASRDTTPPQIDVLDLDDLSILRTLPLTAARAYRFIAGNDGDSPAGIWIADNINGPDAGQVHRVDRETGAIDNTIDTRRWPMGGIVYDGHVFVYCLNNALSPPTPGIGVFKYRISDGAEIDSWINAEDTASYGSQDRAVWAEGQYLAVAWADGHKVFDVIAEQYVDSE